MTVDGFPVQNSISFLPDKPDPSLNEWSIGKTIKILVADFYFNPRWVTWKDQKMWVADYEFFTMMIKQWVTGNPREGRQPMTKEEALDLVFEMQ